VSTHSDRAADVRHEGAWLACVLVFGLALRAWAAWHNPIIFDDGPAFIDIARAMARGDFGSALSHPYHPLYSALIWLTPGSSGHEEAVGVGWSIVAGTGAVAALWWLLRPLFGPVDSLVAAALLAAHPYAVRFSADVQSDQVYLALFLGASGLGVRALKGACRRRAFATGAVVALAYLSRPEGVGVLVVVVALAAAGALRGHWPLRRAIEFVAALGAGFVLLAGPYLACIFVFTGELRLTQKKSLLSLLGLSRWEAGSSDLIVPVGVLALALGLAWATRSQLRSWAVALRVRRFGVTEVAATLGCALLVVCLAAPTSALEFAALIASTLRPELAVLLAIGVVWSAGRPGAPGGRAFFFLFYLFVYGVALFGLLMTEGYLDRRHLLPVSVLLLGYVALGLDVLATALARRIGPAGARGERTKAGRAIAVGVLLCIAIALPKTLRLHRSEEIAARQAAEWVAEQADAGDRIASMRPKAAYYAGLVWVPLLDAGGLRDGASLRRMGTRWVLAEAGDLVSTDGHGLSIEPAPGQRFERVFDVERYGHRALVFEIHEPATAPGRGQD
jgi:hypothetical protein